jgi:hypothetical protein
MFGRIKHEKDDEKSLKSALATPSSSDLSFGTICSHYQSHDTIPSIKNTIDQSFNLTFPIYFLNILQMEI